MGSIAFHFCSSIKLRNSSLVRAPWYFLKAPSLQLKDKRMNWFITWTRIPLVDVKSLKHKMPGFASFLYKPHCTLCCNTWGFYYESSFCNKSTWIDHCCFYCLFIVLEHSVVHLFVMPCFVLSCWIIHVLCLCCLFRDLSPSKIKDNSTSRVTLYELTQVLLIFIATYSCLYV